MQTTPDREVRDQGPASTGASSREAMVAPQHTARQALTAASVIALQRTVGNQAVSRMLASERRVIQRISEAEWLALYKQGNYGLRFQSGAMPDKPIQGDMYGLTDERYDFKAHEFKARFASSGKDKPPPLPTVAQYDAALAETVTRAVSQALGWLLSDNKLTLEQTFAKIRETGQLVLMEAPYRASTADYAGALAKMHKQTIDPSQFKTRIALITPLDYDHFRDRLDERYNPGWKSQIHPYVLEQIRKRVTDAITLLVGGKPDEYAIPPDWDGDPKQFINALDEVTAADAEAGVPSYLAAADEKQGRKYDVPADWDPAEFDDLADELAADDAEASVPSYLAGATQQTRK